MSTLEWAISAFMFRKFENNKSGETISEQILVGEALPLKSGRY